MCYVNSEKPAVLIHTPEEAMALGKTDKAVSSQMKLMQDMQEGKGGNFLEKLTAYDDETKAQLQGSLFEYMLGPESFYCGSPIKVEGITVMSLCCMGIKKPEGWCEKDVKAVEAIAQRIGVHLEKEAQTKKFQHAQQAMMMQVGHKKREREREREGEGEGERMR